MKHRSIIFLLAALLVSCQTLTTEREREIEQRDRAANGISVGEPKVYDDSVLQQMLVAAQARLASLQVLDQTTIGARLGSITGATQQVSSLALSALGAPTPQVATTANGATNQVAQTIGSTNQTVTTTNAPVQNTVTTLPQFNASIPTSVAPTTSLPSAFSVSASDILNEQIQLTYEIANLRLLLEGSLTDRLLINRKTRQQFVKPRMTIGFPIAIAPDKRFRNTVAIVEVEIATSAKDDLSEEGQPPAITALLPREKTYNVAAITDRTTSLGAGPVCQHQVRQIPE